MSATWPNELAAGMNYTSLASEHGVLWNQPRNDTGAEISTTSTRSLRDTEDTIRFQGRIVAALPADNKASARRGRIVDLALSSNSIDPTGSHLMANNLHLTNGRMGNSTNKDSMATIFSNEAAITMLNVNPINSRHVLTSSSSNISSVKDMIFKPLPNNNKEDVRRVIRGSSSSSHRLLLRTAM